MNLTKQEEQELFKVYDTWWDSYLNGDITTYNFFLHDDYRFIGSTGNEEFLNRKDSTAFFEATVDQLAGKAKLENAIRTVENLNGMVLITVVGDAYVLGGKEWAYYARFRFTSLLKQTPEGWRFLYQHFSTPDLMAHEGDTIGTSKVTAENIELRNAIKRRTKELELKNRELQIEAALEKVRARALAMQHPEELKEVAHVLRQEMGLLGVEALETCSIYIREHDDDTIECWYALKHLLESEKKLVSDHFKLNLKDTWVGRQMLNFYSSKEEKTSIVMTGKHRKEWIDYCELHSKPFQGYYGDEIPDRTYHLQKFSDGAIAVATEADISLENWGLLKRASAVFSLAYSRFKDLTQARHDLQLLKEEKKKAEDALKELQSTQKQLIQAEKMASLGELTAGIAHEIQNPLNFVNNFSEVSTELIDEMHEALEQGELDEVKEIATDLKHNLEKITQHGKRAGGIVKGMLQHSRKGSGKKELTDLGVLCDEYLRLSYHGLRAKDKSFNADFLLDVEKNLPKVEVIPQDFGRVMLNLINNAFYAVNEQSKSRDDRYKPTVTVGIKVHGAIIEITVADNGSGIPEGIKEKIFQPFFTTKPTGQGTGLGLSLSYDIVKAAGGELKVASVHSVSRDSLQLETGTVFTISLPV